MGQVQRLRRQRPWSRGCRRARSVRSRELSGSPAQTDRSSRPSPPPRRRSRSSGAALVQRVAALDISAGFVRAVLDDLCSIGSSPLGYRTTGTPEDRETAQRVAGHMRAIGLTDVAIEPVRVDRWRFLSAELAAGGEVFAASSFGGVPGTRDAGLTAPVLDVGDGRRARLDRLDLRGAIALLHWASKDVGPALVALELMRRGVVAIVVHTGPRAAWFKAPGALGAFDAQWPAGAPPMVMIAAVDAERVRALAPTTATVTLRVEQARDVEGYNVVGYLRGDDPGPIVVGAHHDAWFRGAFDNTSGVAAMLALAKAMVGGPAPRHTICFTSRTGEEYGRAEVQHDWCIGAWEQITATHPRWSDDAPFHLCLEASGRRDLRTIVEAPVEYATWARRICRAAADQGWTPTGWRVAPPVAGTEQWPYLVRGVPGVAAYAWDDSFADTEYHTQLDTIETVDCDIVAAQTRLYAMLLLDADARSDEIVDHRARASQLAKIAGHHGSESLAAAADRHRGRTGRETFTAIGTGLHALDAHAAAAYPHEQVAGDVAALDAALLALDDSDPRAALRQLRRVGSNRYHAYLSEPALQAYLDQLTPSAVAGTWGAASHLTQSPNLWGEMTTIAEHGDLTAVRATLHRARDLARVELRARLDAMAAVLDHA